MTEKTYTKEEVNQLIINASATDWGNIRNYMTSAISGGNFTGDTLHAIDLDYGYPEKLDFVNYWNMYRRFGIAKAVVELPIDTGWMSVPEVEGNNQFNTEFTILIEKFNFWQRMKGLDTRQRVGRYAGLFVQVRDNLTPDKPIEGKLPGNGALVKYIPLYESQLKVLDTNDDPSSDKFGDPTMYQFSGSKAGNRDDKNNKYFNIHPSRVIIASEGADDGGIYGISALEGCYNSLMDLRKIIGAGGEGFYKNAAKSIVFNLQDGATAKANKELLGDFNRQFDDFIRNPSRRAIWTPGLEAKTLESNLANPKEFFFNALYDVSASTQIPATILIGQQTGRLASGEDSDHHLSMVQSRRENFMTEMLTNVIDWNIEHGILPASEYEIAWDDLTAITDDDKLGNAERMALINEKQFRSGQGAVFSGEEIKDAAGFEGEKFPEPSETITEENENQG